MQLVAELRKIRTCEQYWIVDWREEQVSALLNHRYYGPTFSRFNEGVYILGSVGIHRDWGIEGIHKKPYFVIKQTRSMASGILRSEKVLGNYPSRRHASLAINKKVGDAAEKDPRWTCKFFGEDSTPNDGVSVPLLSLDATLMKYIERFASTTPSKRLETLEELREITPLLDLLIELREDLEDKIRDDLL